MQPWSQCWRPGTRKRHPILWCTSARLLEPAITSKEWRGHPTTWHIGGKLPISARLDWGVVDPVLYNEAFTGRAKIILRCRYCLVDSHDTKECCFAPEEGHSSVARTVLPAMSRDPHYQGSVPICQLFNKPSGNACRYKHSKYAHVCSKCRRGSHPAAECMGQSSHPIYALSPSPIIYVKF